VVVKVGVFGMDVLVCDFYVISSFLFYVWFVEFDQLLVESDVVVFCSVFIVILCYVLDVDWIVAMCFGVVLVNVVWGGLVDELVLVLVFGDG